MRGSLATAVSLWLAASLVAQAAARAQSAARTEPDLAPATILSPVPHFQIESVAMRTTYYDQTGHGFQSQAGPVQGPGSESLTVWQPQLEVIATQGERVTHELRVPVDIITAASPDAVDAMSSASRLNEAGSFELETRYRADPATELRVHPGFHVEEQMRSWHVGGGIARSFADGNAAVSASFDQNLDWLDAFTFHGVRTGRAMRSTSNLNLGLTQLLSATTVGNVNYGLTAQTGELGNTWNSVPLAAGQRGAELLPRTRGRHALVGRVAQWLPWNGALHGFYRFYVDDWGIAAHSAEAELYQRVSPWLLVCASYRLHWQQAASFFAEHPSNDAVLRTSDSDLARLTAQTIGGMAAFDVRIRGHGVHLEAGYERYLRSNDLQVDIYTASFAFVR